MVVFNEETRHAHFDPVCGAYTPRYYPKSLHAPTDLTLDQFMFSYAPENDVVSPKDGEIHSRPSPLGQTWLIDSSTEKEYSFEDCRRRHQLLSDGLYDHLDLRPGQVVVIYAPNDIDYPLVIWATFRAGGIISGANPSYTASELSHQLATLAKSFTIAGLVTHPRSLAVAQEAASKVGLPTKKILLMSSPLERECPAGIPLEIHSLQGLIERTQQSGFKARQVPRRLQPGENKTKIAFLAFSSGTTGVPKAVCIPHYSVIVNVLMILKHEDEELSGQRTLAALPYYHAYGLIVILHAGLYRNLTNVVVSNFVLTDFLDYIVKYQTSVLYLVPPMIVLLMKHPAARKRTPEISSIVKRILSAAAPLTQELVLEFRSRYPTTRLGQAYGMTETSTLVTSCPNMIGNAPGSSAGVISPGAALKIMHQGKPVGFGHTGEIWIRCQSASNGYLDNPEATAETFGADGYIRSGDKGYINHMGWLFVVDRLKELIKVKGNQVAPAELEGHLLAHPDIEDVCVVGVPDDYAGELPKAFVVRSQAGLQKAPNELAETIKRWVSDHKARHKWLDGGVEFVNSIPKNPSGKLLRRQLRGSSKPRTQYEAHRSKL